MHRLRLLAVLGLLILAAETAPLVAQEYVWIEGEKPSSTNVKPNIAGWGRKQFLSGEQWLHYSIDADKVDQQVPGDGIHITYPFTLKNKGKYQVWNRVGFEFVRSPLAWRIDGGDWAKSGPEELTTDLMEIDFFCEVAWLKLGDRELKSGEHTLEILLPKTKDDKGKTARILYTSDALCLYQGEFQPNGKYKPGEDWRDDKDRAAGKHVFALPEPTSPGKRSSVALKGQWEVCRHDEQLPGEVAAPIKDVPKEPHWMAIPVPGDKGEVRPELIFAHRIWYRTRVRVPESCAGKSFYLVFPQNNLNTTVTVNGIFCGFDKNPFARLQIDVTKAVKPGVNEVWVGIKDAWYGRSANPDEPMKLRKLFNLPRKFFHDGWQDLSYPVWNHPESGILNTPEFVAAGAAYTADVFCQPSVARKELALDVTVSNPTKADVTGEVVCEAVNAEGKVEKAFAPQAVTVAAGAEKVLKIADKWEQPKLWWPDEPVLYTLRTTVRSGGKVLDVEETPFGFREWTTAGKDFKLNGVAWHGWADTHTHRTKEEWLAFYHKSNQRFMRFWGTSWMGLEPEEAFGFFDKSGVVVRRSGIFDGEGIGYLVGENDPALRKKYNSDIKMDLSQNWRDQVVAQVKGERNHPSIMVWSIENEWLYIACANTGTADPWEPEVTKSSEAVRAADPTRPTMCDGGGATKANTLPVHGDHYTTGAFSEYPALAYEPNVTGGGRGRWVWDQKRPRYIGEELFAQGHNTAYAYFGGEEVFVGQVNARRAVGIFVRILTEGYRWGEYGAWQFWQMQDVAVGQYDANALRAVFCRQWDWTFASGQKVGRTFGIFNDTHSDDPMAFTWTLSVGGKKVAEKTTEHHVVAGRNEKFEVALQMPQVEGRQEGELVLTLAVKGQEVYRDVKAVSVLGDENKQLQTQEIGKLGAKDLLVYDPKGTVTAHLKTRGVAFTTITDLNSLPNEGGKVLVVGKDALSVEESTSSRLAAFASAGRTVVVLEQKHPLKYQGVPAEIDAAVNEGRIAFGEDLDHAALRGLQQKDFFAWNADEIVYRNAYLKPARGAKSLVQCHESLQNSALVEVPVANGVLLLCQLVVEEKLETNAVARQLFANLLNYGATYKLEQRKVVACTTGSPMLEKVLEGIGLQHTGTRTPLQALEAPGCQIAIIAATPENLKELAANKDKVRRFTEGGGWIVFHGLTPEGLVDYNQLVGFEHMIRPFRRERITFPAVRNHLMAGVTLSDVVLYSSEQIFPWQAGNFVASDVFSYVVDYDDVAPFAKFPNDFIMNMVNGFTTADAWKYIVNVDAPEKPPLDWLLKLPKEQEIIEMQWTGNTLYYPVTRVELFFDGKEKASFVTEPHNRPQLFAVDPPRKGKDITLRLADWEKLPGVASVTGLDNLKLKAKRPAEFYKNVRPMLNLGGLMEYPQGQGGIVLCNLLFKDQEEVPVNFTKKRTVFSTILRNLKAPFSGERLVLAGANLQYETVDLSKAANQYRTERGWFGDAKFTFKDLPTGTVKLAGVTYQVYDFPTSPVPTVVMLGGNGVPNNPAKEVRGIAVNRKADALFFLHTMRLDQRRNEKEVAEKKKYETLRYVVTYADGQTEDVPVYAEIDIEDYRQKQPAAIAGAQMAWTKAYEGTEFTAVAYAKQWTNPRPGTAIKSIDMVYGAEPRGVPVLLAVTAATGK